MLKVIGKINRKLLSVYIIIVFFAIWEIVPRTGLVNPVFIPPFSVVLGAARKVTYSQLALHTLVSLKRILIGYGIATALAVPAGFLLGGAFPRLERLLKSLTVFLSSIPPFILSPIIIIIYGMGEVAIDFVIFWAAFWPIMFTTVAGVQQVNPLYVKSAKSMGSNNLTIFLKVIIPGALSSILTGMKTGLTMSFMMLIGAETIGSQAGLGWLIFNSQSMGFIPRTFLAVLLILVVGLVFEYLFQWFEKRIIVWKEISAD